MRSLGRSVTLRVGTGMESVFSYPGCAAPLVPLSPARRPTGFVCWSSPTGECWKHAPKGRFGEKIVGKSLVPTRECSASKAGCFLTLQAHGKFSVHLVYPGTAFQRRVWEQLLGIPYGETRSYEEIGATLGEPKASRAVGRANGLNRLAILIPCHRVVNKNGELGGYGGGLRRKQYLLDLERSDDPEGGLTAFCT